MQLSPRAGFLLQASIVVTMLSASSAPTPLYALYQASWGFSPITTTLVFGVYAVAVLSALLVVGRLSDHVGRKPVILAALAIQIASVLVFVTAQGTMALFLARIVQGLGAGAAVGALGAGMIDVDRERGTIANAVAPATGTATGGITSGLLVQLAPWPTRTVYVVFLGLFLVQALLVTRMAESSSPKPGGWESLVPSFAVPPRVRKPLLLVAPVLVASWALAGFYGALGPTLLKRMAHSSSPILGGLALFALAGSGALTVAALHTRAARTLMLVGTVALMTGVAVSLVAMQSGSLATFFVGTVVAGAGFGASFQGAIRTVVPLAAPHERAGVLSVVFVISYLAMGLPAVVAGFRVVYGSGVLATAREYGTVVAALSFAAFLGAVLRGTTAQSEAASP